MSAASSSVPDLPPGWARRTSSSIAKGDLTVCRSEGRDGPVYLAWRGSAMIHRPFPTAAEAIAAAEGDAS